MKDKKGEKVKVGISVNENGLYEIEEFVEDDDRDYDVIIELDKEKSDRWFKIFVDFWKLQFELEDICKVYKRRR